MSNNMKFFFHKVLIIIMTTTTTTSPTPRPTLSLRSEAFLRNRDASDRKRSLEVFSRSDLATINLEIGWRLFFMFLHEQNLSWSSERLFPLLRTAPILPLITPVTLNKIITAKNVYLFQGSLKVPKMDFFIKHIFEVWVFYKYAKLSFL